MAPSTASGKASPSLEGIRSAAARQEPRVERRGEFTRSLPKLAGSAREGGQAPAARGDGSAGRGLREKGDALPSAARPRQIRLSGPIEHDSIVNGYGLRAVIWTQGCPNHCPGCQNPETWDFSGGVLVDVPEVEQRLAALSGQAGLTFCGGEPFVQPEACKEIADWCRRELGWNIWSFSGFTYEQIKAAGGAGWEFLKSLDYLIDGPFIQAERDLTLKFRGSRNQRLIHLQHGTGEILEIEETK